MRFSLRYYKKRDTFIDTPDKCPCNHRAEDIDHFLFLGPFYATCRETLMTNVIQILQKRNLNRFRKPSRLYLYGYRNINFAENKTILL